MLSLPQLAQCAPKLVAYEAALANGLERAWYAQARLDPARETVVNWHLDGEHIFALTSTGTIHTLHAETGETLWVADAGSDNLPYVGPGVNEEYVAVLSATHLYVFSRSDGRPIWSQLVSSAPAAKPALSDRYAFVPLLDGQVEAYVLEDPTADTWQYQSAGRIFSGLVVSDDVVSWPTTLGYLYVANSDPPRVLFRLHTNAEIVTPPAYQAPYLYVPSLDGYLYCIEHHSGLELWKYATGYPITQSPAFVGTVAYVASEAPTLHAIEATDGTTLWRADGVSQFVAQGNSHIYGLSPFGDVMILDKRSGAVVGQLGGRGNYSALINDDSDRIYLVDKMGLIQCLHEIGASEPTWHDKVEGEEPTGDQQEEIAEDAPAEPPPAQAPPAEPAESPFSPFIQDSGADDDEPEAEPAEEDNPFNPFD